MRLKGWKGLLATYLEAAVVFSILIAVAYWKRMDFNFATLPLIAIYPIIIILADRAFKITKGPGLSYTVAWMVGGYFFLSEPNFGMSILKGLAAFSGFWLLLHFVNKVTFPQKPQKQIGVG